MCARSLRRLALVLAGFTVSTSAAFATGHLFNASESAIPGSVIHLQGDGLGTTPKVYFYVVQGNESSLTTPPNPSANVLPSSAIISATTNDISVRLPKNNPMGLFAVWVSADNGSTYAAAPGNISGPVYINRARAMSFEYDAVPAGYLFRIFGRNLFINGATPSVSFVNAPGTAAYTAAGTVVTSFAGNDTATLQVTAPASLPTSGNFMVKISNGLGGATQNAYNTVLSEETLAGRTGGSDPFSLGVPWGSDFVPLATPGSRVVNGFTMTNPLDVTTAINPHTNQPYSALNDMHGNWNNAIQQALYDAGNPTYYQNGAIVYLPARTYPLDHASETIPLFDSSGTSITQPPSFELIVPAHVVLKGAGIGNTILSDTQSPPAATSTSSASAWKRSAA